jgi:hypothetical protein
MFWRLFKKEEKWKFLQGWTLVAGIMIIAMIVLMKLSQLESNTTNSLKPFLGLFQRVLLCTYFGWTFIVALKMLENVKRQNASTC